MEATTIIRTLRFQKAGTTVTTAQAILPIKGVSVLATCSGAALINALRDWLKVLWSNTDFIAAQMVKLQSVWARSHV